MDCAAALELPDRLVYKAVTRHVATGCAYILTGRYGAPSDELSMIEVPPGGNVPEVVLADLARYPDDATVRAWLLDDEVHEMAWAPVDDLCEQVRHWAATVFGSAFARGCGIVEHVSASAVPGHGPDCSPVGTVLLLHDRAGCFAAGARW